MSAGKTGRHLVLQQNSSANLFSLNTLNYSHVRVLYFAKKVEKDLQLIGGRKLFQIISTALAWLAPIWNKQTTQTQSLFAKKTNYS